jgi:transcriptional regulator with XRE-family HTH domain
VVVLTRKQADKLFAGEIDDDLQRVRDALSEGLRRLRLERGITQAELARRIGSSQPRIAKIEAGEPATFDLLMKCLRAVDASWEEVTEIMRGR